MPPLCHITRVAVPNWRTVAQTRSLVFEQGTIAMGKLTSKRPFSLVAPLQQKFNASPRGSAVEFAVLPHLSRIFLELTVDSAGKFFSMMVECL